MVLQRRIQDLDRDRSLQFAVDSSVDGTHATAAEELEVIELGQAAGEFVGG